MSSDLHDILTRYQRGDSSAGWEFTQHKKIKAIIRGRMRQYASMFKFLTNEQLQDIQGDLSLRLIEIAGRFELPEAKNDGRIVSYFSLRIKGEADYLLKKVTGMKQVVDPETQVSYLRLIQMPIDSINDSYISSDDISEGVIDTIDRHSQAKLLAEFIASIPKDSNDLVWLQCYQLRLAGKTWATIANEVNYTNKDFSYIKENTARFVTRLKNYLLMSGQQVSYTICGIYSDDSNVAIAVLNFGDNNMRDLVWWRDYDTYDDLEKIELKLSDIFRVYEITYVMINDYEHEPRSTVVLMRYLNKREAFVEFVDIKPFITAIGTIPDDYASVSLNQFHKRAMLLARIKKVCNDLDAT